MQDLEQEFHKVGVFLFFVSASPMVSCCRKPVPLYFMRDVVPIGIRYSLVVHYRCFHTWSAWRIGDFLES